MKSKRLITTFLLAAAGTTACSTPSTSPMASQVTPDETAVEISYLLNGSRWDFRAERKGADARARSTLDGTTLKERIIEDRRYAELVTRTETFIQNSRTRVPASSQPCRSPFLVRVKRGEDASVLHGCRGSDDGGLSRIVKQAEFLLHSNP